MALILHIDTALKQANIGLADHGTLLVNIQNEDQYSHASFVQPAIQKALRQSDVSIDSIDAVGVTAGPGSYTGLRVAMASAKGLCYALNKPLLAVNTLEVMATAAIEKFPGFDFYCPMIDARRNEVYTSLYTSLLDAAMPVTALILEKTSFEEALSKATVLYFGNGSIKFKNTIGHHENAFFEEINYSGAHLAKCLLKSFKHNGFQDLAYAEPFYVKDFYLGK
ncbi:MAG: tRNA (adenosine(37)-N6)-threonylcarbamoyltransferase complex dimerization subunit type 1 TsaB [Agriterribacter sp.]